MNAKKSFPILVALFLVCLGSPVLRADTLSASLVNAALTGTAGSSITFQANVSNPSGTDTFLNGDSSITSSILVSVNDTPFILNAPVSLGSGGIAGPFDIFTVVLDPSIAAGIYTGTFSILGGADGASSNDLADLNFTVNVTPSTSVPEPGTLQMVLVGAFLVFFLQKLRSA
jgi:hypothetical protein